MVWKDVENQKIRVVYTGTNSDTSNVLQPGGTNADWQTNLNFGNGVIDPSLYDNQIFLDNLHNQYGSASGWTVDVVGESQSGVHLEFAMAYMKQKDSNFFNSGVGLNPLNISPALAQAIANDPTLNTQIHLTGQSSTSQFGNLVLLGNSIDLTNNLNLQPEGANKIVMHPDKTLAEYLEWRLPQLKNPDGSWRYTAAEIESLLTPGTPIDSQALGKFTQDFAGLRGEYSVGIWHVSQTYSPLAQQYAGTYGIWTIIPPDAGTNIIAELWAPGTEYNTKDLVGEYGSAKLLEVINLVKDIYQNTTHTIDDIWSSLGNAANDVWDAINGLFRTAEGIVLRLDPLILDLNGDGIISTTTVENGKYFDMDANDFAERTAWVGSGDGVLVRDLNNNNQIDNGNELFGDRTLLSNSNYAQNGFQALADLDSNLDGVIDANDTYFSELKILRSDGYLGTLSDLGIQSINLSAPVSNQIDASGNTQAFLGQFTWDNNTTSAIGSYNLLRDSADTIFKETIAVSTDILELPEARGQGNVMDLRQAMAHDSTGALQDLIEAFIDETDLAARDALVDDILAQWANTVGVTPGSRGVYADAQQLAILEAFEGRYMDGSATSQITIQAKGLTIGAAYDSLHNLVFAQLEAQTHLKPLLDELVITSGNGQSFINLDGPEQTILDAISIDEASGKEMLADFVRVIKTFDLHLTSNFDEFYNTFSALGSDYEWILNAADMNQVVGTSSAERLEGTQFADAMQGGNGADTLIGWEGNDYITGDSGDDFLQGCVGDDTVLGGDGNDSLFGIYDKDSLLGGIGNDTLDGGTENDTLIGGIGNDSLIGGTGDDTYVFNLGDGQDTISEEPAYEVSQGNDTIKFGPGITPDDVTFSGVLTDYVFQDMVISINGTTDRILIKNQMDVLTGSTITPMPKIENFVFADGTVLTFADVLNRLETHGTSSADEIHASSFNDKVFGYDGNDSLFGEYGGDTLYGGNGNDFLNGGAHNDVLYGGDGNDLLYGETEDDSLDGGAGDDSLEGGDGNDTVRSGTGNDTINEGFGNDTYIYRAGDGQDIIQYLSPSLRDGNDTLKFEDLLQNQVTFTAVGGSIDILINGTSDKIRLLGILPDASDYVIEQVQFADGSSVTREQIINSLLEIQGTNAVDTLSGSSWNEKISGFAGNDTLNGGIGTDTLIGGVGNDSLIGGDSNDTYVFNLGDGQDIISEDPYSANSGTSDTLKFGPGITVNDVIFTGQANNLTISINGTSDSIYIGGQLQATVLFGQVIASPLIENFVFDDGTVLTAADVAGRLEVNGTSGNNYLEGTLFGEKIYGYDGNDSL